MPWAILYSIYLIQGIYFLLSNLNVCDHDCGHRDHDVDGHQEV